MVRGGEGRFVGPVALAITVVYLVLATLAMQFARRAGRVPGWGHVTTACADVTLVFALTIAFSPPLYYGRVLLLALLVLSLTAFHVGQRSALVALFLTLVAYPLVVRASVMRGAPLVWGEEIWSLAVFVVVAAVVFAEQAHLRRRLEAIAVLFGRAEEGDFSEAYDEPADTRADAITVVGRAYNRVREQLSSLVLTDALTGCVNRRGFDQSLAREVARATRAGSELSLLAMDLDHFKSVNDTLGHLAGDMVLREIGALLTGAARTGDVVARTGGEEFCLILPDTPAAGAYNLATRLCDAIRAHDFRSGTNSIRLTASIGVVSQASPSGPTRDVAEVLKGRADEALYAAKRGGRDRVRVWAPKDEQDFLAPVW